MSEKPSGPKVRLRKPRPLGAIDPSLDAATERLNELFEAAAEVFRRDLPGVSAAVEVVGAEPEVGDSSAWWLEFKKSGDTWGLFFVVVDTDDGDEISIAPIASSPRRFRILAAGKLGELRDKLERERDRELREVEDACATIQKFLEGDEA